MGELQNAPCGKKAEGGQPVQSALDPGLSPMRVALCYVDVLPPL